MTLFAGFAATANAQQFEEPAATAIQEEQRIVDGRPKLHSIKRTLHPLTWLDAGIKPILGLIEGQSSNFLSTEQKVPRVSGIKFSIDKAGSGSGIGPRVKPFHNDLFGTGIAVELPLLMTYKRYESYRFIATVPVISDEDSRTLSVELSAGYRSRPSDNFFGIGNDSAASSRTRVRSVIREAEGAININLTDAWKSRIAVGHSNVGITEPYGDRDPSAQDSFRDSAVPGLKTGGKLLSTSISIERNTLDGLVPGSGGLHRVEAGLHEGSGRGDFSYWKYRYDLEHYFPLSDDHRKVIAIRGRLETNEEKGGSQVPFFDLPYIGGRSTLRGFDSFRFMDKSALNIGAEYRYRIWRAFDVGLFVDQGQVAPEIGDFGWDRFHTGYGARLVVRPTSNYAMSFDAGRSAEGWRLYIDFSSNF